VDEDTPGAYEVVYSATDNAGNTGTATLAVTVVDETAPVLTLSPRTISVACGADLGDVPTPTATDACEGNLTAAVALNDPLPATDTPGMFVVTYSVRDSADNESTVDLTIDVTDTTPPTVTLSVSEMTLGCGETFVAPAATATDACAGDISDRIQIDDSEVNVGQPDTYTVTYRATDDAGNTGIATLPVIVADNTRPVLTLPASPQTVACGASFSAPEATAMDACDGDLTRRVTAADAEVNTGEPGQYTVAYSVTDDAGNTATGSIIVNVVDTNGPNVTIAGGADTITVACGATPNLPNATAVDDCEGNVTNSLTIDDSAVTIDAPGTYTVTYTAVDTAGNVGTAMLSVTVEDTTDPMIMLSEVSEMVTLNCGEDFDPAAILGIGTDNCGEPVVTVDASAVDTTTAGTYAVNYTATDGAGNTATATLTVVVVDDNAPAITLNDGDAPGTTRVTVMEDNPFVDPGATAEDVCDGSVTVAVSPETIDTSTPGMFTLTYTATDRAGNAATATRVVVVTDDDDGDDDKPVQMFGCAPGDGDTPGTADWAVVIALLLLLTAPHVRRRAH